MTKSTTIKSLRLLLTICQVLVLSSYGFAKTSNGKNLEDGKSNSNDRAWSVSAQVINNLCFGGEDGSILISNTGGVSPFVYLWSNGQTTKDLMFVVSGTYTVTVTDNLSATTTVSATITEPSSAVTITLDSLKNVICGGFNTGSIYISTTGGTPGYTYTWTASNTTGNSNTAEDRTNLGAGTYNVLVEDLNGCSAISSYTLSSPTQLTCLPSIIQGISCNGGNNSILGVVAMGGTLPYSYLWSNGQTTQTATGFAFGLHHVTVTDANTCNSICGITLNQPTKLIVTETHLNVTTTGGNNGSITLTVSGGTPAYFYLWSNGSTTKNISGLTAGTYSVNVTDTKGCLTQLMVIITEPNPSVSVTISATEPTCFGFTNGNAVANPIGGAIPYSYLWSNGATSSSIQNLAAGVYSVKVTDNGGATVTASKTISNPADILITSQFTAPTCNGGINGTITLSVTGGTGQLSYLWSNGSTTKDINNIASGTYSVTVTDTKSCTKTTVVTVPNNPVLICSINQIAVVNCFGGNTAEAIAVPSGGVAGYSYIWSNGQTLINALGLTVGNYSLTVTDSKGCTSSCQIAISQPSDLSISEVHTDVTTSGGNNGTIDITVTGGTTPYNYLWNGGNTNEDQSGLIAGTYTVVVTDANGCVETISTVISQPNSTPVPFLTVTDINCAGSNNGSISTTTVGGSSPYTYLWNNGSTNANRTNLAAGSYTVTVTDANSATGSASVTVLEPFGLVVFVLQTTNNTCNGAANGAIDIDADGGIEPYSFVWSNGQLTEDASNLLGGTYTVTVTDANGCSVTKSATINQPAAIICALSVVNQISCFGGTNGSVQITATGGSSPYTYLWSNGLTSQTIGGLISGNYSVTITDAANCTSNCTLLLAQPTMLIVNETHSDLSAVNANDGIIDITVSGGTPSYAYLWNDGNTNQDRSSLASATYTVTVTDLNNCTTSVNVNIAQPSCTLEITETHVDVSVPNSSNGLINIIPSGGVSPITYLWNDGITTEDRSNIAAGTYTVTAADASSCIAIKTINISQPLCALALSKIVTNVTLHGAANGSINVTATGSFGTVNYLWNNGNTNEDRANLPAGTYTVTATDAGNCTVVEIITITQPACSLALSETHINVTVPNDNTGSIDITAAGGLTPISYLWNSGSTNEDRFNLTAGTRTVTATDAGNCTATKTITITQPTCALALSETHVNVTLTGGNNGSIVITATGGFAPVTYLWNNGNTNQNRNGLKAGSYTVTATDAGSCTALLTVIITQPACALSLTESHVDVTLPNGNTGAINITAANGLAPISYIWNSGNTNEDRINLVAGTYTVTATDAGLCTATKTIVITQPACAIALSESHINVSTVGGSNGSINISTTGGFGTVTYVWNNGNTNEDRAGLTAGTYTVTATDAGNCTATKTVVITQPICSLVLAETHVNVTTVGGNNGSINISASGGITAVSYVWNNGNTNEDRTSLTAGTYTVTATDAANCTAVKTVIITQPTCGMSISETHGDVTTPGGNNGFINITISGGAAPVTYLWNDGITSEDRTNITAGTYTITATDIIACTAVQTITITQPICGLVITETHFDVSLAGGNDGAIDISTTGNFGSISYEWNDGNISEDRVNLIAGTYTVTATDEANCKKTKSIVITQPLCALVLSETHVNVSIPNGNNGSITITPSGGLAPVTYLWNGGNTNKDRANLIAGTYTVTATDAGNCTTSKTIAISQPSCALALSETHVNVTLTGGNNGSINITQTGGFAPLTYLWNNSNTNQNRSGLIAGTYTVTATDAGNCTAIKTINITQPSCALTLSETHVNVSLPNGNNGSINIITANGLAPIAFVWNDGNTNEDRNNLVAGTYTASATDAGNCTASKTVTITQPICALALTETHNNVVLVGGNTGSINITAAGGFAPVGYVWNDGNTNEDRSNLVAGVYTVTALDAGSCSASGIITITEPQCNIIVTESHTDVTIPGGTDGSINVTVTGFTAPLSYLWQDGNTNQDRNNVSSGTYVVTVTDASNCTASLSIVLLAPGCSLLLNETHVDVTFPGGNNGSINITPIGGFGAVTYLWNNGSTNEDRINLAAGTRTVTATDAGNCTATKTVTITQPSCALVLTETHVNVLLHGDNDGSINMSSTGGFAPVNYVWNNGNTNEDRLNLIAGTYTVTATDAGNCSAIETIIITQPACAIVLSETHQDVSIPGANNGSIAIDVTGALPALSYLWNDGNTNEDRIGLIAGTYVITVTDAGNCTSSLSIIISEPACSLAISETHNNVTIAGGNNGSIDISVTGGFGTVTYLWNNGNINEDRFNLTAGIRTITVTDAANCTATKTITITQPACAVILTETHTDVSIAGGNDGTIDISNSGALAPVNYLWSDGSTNEDRSNLTAATYTVTATDAGNCTAQMTIDISQPICLFTLTEAHTNISIAGYNDGGINITPISALAPITYLWSDAVTLEDRSNLFAGTYTVLATDAGNCTTSLVVTLTEPACAFVLSELHNDVTIAGGNDGSINTSVAGGLAPVSYLWNDGNTNEDRSNLIAGTYTVSATDAGNCMAVETITIQQPSCALTLSETHVNVTIPGGNNGSIDIVSAGGILPIAYLWNNGNTNEDRFNQTAGVRTVTATDAAGCTATKTVTITQPSCAIALTETHVDVSIAGGSDGAIDILISGEFAPVGYLWNDGNTNQDRSNLIAGSYTITATDAGSCIAIITITVAQPACALILSETHSDVTLAGGNNGAINITPSGGLTPVTYVWNDGNTNEDRSNLIAAIYTVTATDAGNCSGESTITIAQPLCAIALAETHLDVTIAGGNNGAIAITTTGQFAPVAYLWNDGNTDEDRSNLTAATYTVTATDAGNCSTEISITITQPACALAISATQNDVTIPNGTDGSIDITSGGGLLPVTYLWNDGDTNEDRSNLSAATYTVTVTDAGNCTAEQTIIIAQPLCSLALTETHVNVSVPGGNDGSIDITSSGAFGAVTYLWNNGNTNEDRFSQTAGIRTVTATDAGGCTAVKTVTITQPACAIALSETHTDVSIAGGNDGSIDITTTGQFAPVSYLWNNGSSNEDRTNLTVGVYTLTATDAGNCSAVVTVNISQPSCALVIAETHINVFVPNANTGSIDISSSGGLQPVTYLWNDGITNEDRSGLMAGTYTVVGTDDVNCVAIQTIEITEPPCAIALAETHLDVTIAGGNNGVIAITTTSQFAPVAYLWNDGNTDEDRSNLTAATYTVTATDAGNCSTEISITITQPACALAISATQNDVTIPNGTDGSIDITSGGGLLPVTYLWNDGDTNEDRSNLSAVTYTVIVTDAVNCTAEQTIIIAQPLCSLALTETHVNVTIPGGNDGSIDITSSGAFGAVTYLWNNGNTNEDRFSQTAGIRTVTATDAGGCTAVKTVTITQPACAITLTETHTDVTITGGNDGSIDITASGEFAPVTYIWNDGDTNADRSNLLSGNYTVTATDSGNCSAIKVVTINQPGCAISLTETHTNVTLYGGNDGTIDLSVSGGLAPVAYLWNDGNTNEDRNTLAAGTYIVTATDGANCSAALSVNLSEPICTIALSATQSDVTIPNGTDGSIDLTVVSGILPVTYLWNDGDTNEDRSNLSAVTYTVIVTDAVNCTAEQTIIIAQPLCSLALTETHVNVTIPGGNDGSIDITSSGAFGAVTYLWNNGNTNEDRFSQTAGIRTVTATDAGGCTAVKTVTITQPACAITLTETHTDVTITGGNDGSIDITASGEFAPVTYIWNDGDTNADRGNLLSGNYTVTATDSGNCSAIKVVTINQPGCAISLTETHTNVTLYGGNDGTIDLSVSGGLAPVAYLWNDGNTNEDRNTLAAGTYIVTATDGANCSAALSVNLSEPICTIALSATQSDVTIPNGTDGSIDLTVVSGILPVTYLWNDGDTNEDRSNLSAVTYTVIVTDAVNCTAEQTIIIAQPLCSLALTETHVNVTIPGGNDGSIDITSSGAFGAVTYLWNNGNTNEDRFSQTAGIRTVTATDAGGCTAVKTVTITQPACAITLTETHTDVTITGGNDGSIDITASGEFAPVTYIWNDGDTNADRSNLLSGNYTVTATDSGNCSAIKVVTINQPGCAISLTETHTNVTLYGGNDGTIDLSVSGGLAPVAYLWNDGNTNEDRNTLAAGTYIVTATDGANCSAALSVNLSEPICTIALSATQSDVTIPNGTDGSIDLTVVSGILPVTYLWNDGDTNEDRSNLSAVTYTVIVTDAVNCTAEQTIIIAQPLCSLALTETHVNVTIPGGNDGSIDITSSGAFGAVTYLWNNGNTNEDRFSQTAGIRTVTATDAGGCTAVKTVTITQPACAITLTETHTDVTITGGNDGSIDITASGEFAPVTYIWNDGDTNADRGNLLSGNYTVTATDSGNCSATLSITITQPLCALVLSETHADVTLPGGNSGSINITATGGINPMTYLWDNGDTNEDRSNLFAGTYTVTVFDASNCQEEKTIVITQPACALVLTETHADVTVPGGNDGSIDITSTGGFGTVTYLWNNGNTNEDRFNQTAGTRTITATDSANCTAILTVTITQPSCALVLSETHLDVSIAGANDASIDITVTGQYNSVIYLWNDGNTNEDRNTLIAGIYTVTATDAGNCTAIVTITISQPLCALELTETHLDITQPGGNNGSINTTVSAEFGNVNYIWNDGNTNANRNNLVAGTYNVIATDQGGCNDSLEVILTQPEIIVATIISTNSTCYGLTNASANAAATGGVTPLSYLWSIGQTTQNIGSIGAGVYTVTVTDIYGNTGTESVLVTEPDSLAIEILSASNPKCYSNSNGYITTKTVGGTMAYNYLWSDNSTNSSITSLGSGVYAVIVTDANGCTASVIQLLTEPDSLICSTSLTVGLSCYGQSSAQAEAIVIGGTPNYTYLWSNGNTGLIGTSLSEGSYTFNVTDASGCAASSEIVIAQPMQLIGTETHVDVTTNGGNDGSIAINVSGGVTPYTYLWNDGDTNVDRTSLFTGVYTIVITDANGCTQEITTTISQPNSPPSLLLSGTNLLCENDFTGAITTLVFGGNSPFSFLWSNGFTTQDIDNLAAGTYTLTATDSIGQTATASITITEPLGLIVLVSGTTDNSCFGGMIGVVDIDVINGAAPYLYSWSDGSITEDLSNISAGTYTVVVTDFNGCTNTASATVFEPAQLTCNIIVTDSISCFGNTNASVSVNAQGGVAGYNYLWSTGNTDISISGLNAGTYSVTVTDVNFCTSTCDIIVTSPATLSIAETHTNVTTVGGADGTIDITINGGTAPFTYLWSNLNSTEDISGLASGLYTVIVTDFKGCTATLVVQIEEPGCTIIVTYNKTNVSQPLGNDGAIDVAVSNTIGSVAYLWSDGDTNEDRSNLTAGTYTVTVTDGANCTVESTIEIEEPLCAISLAETHTNVSTPAGLDGTIDISVTGEFGLLNYLWSDGDTNQDRSGLSFGTYTVTVTDAANCMSSISILIAEPACAIMIVETHVNVSAASGSDGSIDITVIGGFGIVTYMWDDGSTNEDRFALTAGTYTVTATDASNCNTSIVVEITQPSCAIILTETHVDVIVPNANTGSIDITANGAFGNVSYLWNNGDSNEDRNNLSAGIYTVIATDAGNCTAQISVTIIEPACALAITKVHVNVTTPGGNDGTITITETGGYPVVTYLWNDGNTNKDRTNLVAGTYTVTATDGGNCTAMLVIEIDEPACAIALTEIHSDVSTVGGSDGSITIITTGAFGFVNYIWNDGNTTADRINLPAGIYAITATDSSNCTTSLSISIADPICAIILAETHTDVSLPGGADGTIDLTTNGATGSLNYVWSDGDTNDDRTNLSSGTYTVTVTDGVNCTNQISIAINEPGCTVSLSETHTDVTLPAGTDGTIDLTATGANGSVTYLWNDGDTNEDRSNLVSGTFSIIATDASNCLATLYITITEPVCAISLAQKHDDVTTIGGSDGEIKITITGEFPPVSYIWNDGDTNEDRTNLMAGVYTVTATDAGNCAAQKTVTIEEPSCTIVLLESHIDASIPTGADGSISITETGGTGTVSYLWSNGSTTKDLVSLVAGVYTVVATDTVNCVVTLTITITEPLCGLQLAQNHIDVSTPGGNNGSINITAVGNFGSVAYLWNDGNTGDDRANLVAGTYTVVATDSANCTSQKVITITEPVCAIVLTESHTNVTATNGSDGVIDITPSGAFGAIMYLWNDGDTNEDRSSLIAGTYTVSASDEFNCTASISVVISEPIDPLVLTTTIGLINCNGFVTGIEAMVTGGKPSYTYLWSNGSTNSNTGIINSGITYTITVTDVLGTIVSQTVLVPLYQPLNISVINITNAYCGINSGTIDLNYTGGQGALTYLWNDGDTNQNRSMLTGGSYTVTVTDAIGCNKTASFTILSSDPIVATLSQTHIVTCFNGGDGVVESSVTGGTQPYYYLWSDGQITANANNLEAGTYTVTVYDSNGCSGTSSITVSAPVEIIITETHTDVGIFGAMDGTIDIGVSGGVPSYVYVWDDGVTSEDRSALAAGTYTLTVTDVNGCFDIITVQIANPVCSLYVTATMLPASIHGAADGSIDMTLVNAIGSSTYLWDSGETTEDLAAVPAGIYIVLVSDGSGCTSGITVIVTEPNCDINLSETSTSATIHGAADGAIDLSVSNYFGSLSYLWNDGATIEDRTNVSAGLYTVTVTDAGGCTKQINSIVEQPACALTLAETHINASMHGAPDGSIDITIGSYYGSLTYLWNNGATTEDLVSIQAGTYIIIATDQGGCTISETISITEPACAIAVSEVHADATIFGAGDGFIDISVNNFYGSLSYQWSNGETSEDIYGLFAGSYTVTVTDAGGCTESTSVEISQPPCNIILSETHSDPTVHGASDGSIDITVSNANGTLSFAWNDGAFTEDRLAIPAGTYTVVVTDGAGCTAQIVVVLVDPACTMSIAYTKTDVTVAGGSDGSIDVTVSNSFGNVYYLWNDGYAFPDRTGLPAGNYTLSVTDGGGCFAAVTIAINQGGNMTVTIKSTDALCNGSKTGTANAITGNGVAPYTYLWSNGKTTKKVFGLTAGIYTVTVTDALSAMASASVSIAEPQKLILTKIITDLTCNGDPTGAIDITTTGGTMPYSYNWSNGATTQDIYALDNGQYKLVVSDSNGCIKKISAWVSQPSLIRPDGTETDVSCYGGSDGAVAYTVAGGFPPYTYLWNDGTTTLDRTGLVAGIYTLSITDSIGCVRLTTKTIVQPDSLTIALNSTDPSNACSNDGTILTTVTGGTSPQSFLWSDGVTNANRNNIGGGVYTVTVSNNGGCSVSASVTLNQAEMFTVNETVVDVLCFNQATGAITLTVVGGVNPFAFVWSNGATTQDIVNIKAGIYKVTVTDSSGCTLVKSITVTQNAAITITKVITNISCFNEEDGSIDINATGGSGPYSYLWSSGDTDEDISSLSKGIYTVTVTDANGCTATAVYVIIEPGKITALRNKTNVTCNGGNDGSVTWQTYGGTPSYNYLWSDGSILSDRFDLMVGNYIVTITDANGCNIQTGININQPAAISALVIGTDQTGYCTLDGTATVYVTGGVPTISYLWSDGQTTQTATGLGTGVYSVLVTDNNGCSVGGSTTISGPGAIVITATTIGTCAGTANGAVTTNVVGGVPAFTYFWSNGSTTENLTGLTAGTYTVTVIDALGCSANESFEVQSYAFPIVQLSQSNVACFGEANGSIDLTLNAADGPYTFLWNDGTTNEDHSALAPGDYTVTVSNNNGCSVVNSATITEPDVLKIKKVKHNITCFGESNGTLEILPKGGTPPYTYLWNNGETVSSRTNLPKDTYTITVTDANGCTKEFKTKIHMPSKIKIDIASTDVTVNGNADGTAQVTIVDAGVAPFTYLWSSGETVANITGLSAATYTVTVTDSKGCTAIDSVTINEPNASAKFEEGVSTVHELLLEAYPNPTRGELNLRYYSLNAESVTVRIYNVVGELVFIERRKANIGQNVDHYQLDILPKGVYSLQFKLGDTIKVNRIVVQ